MISIGPRFGFFVSTLSSVQRVQVGGRRLEQRLTRSRHADRVVQVLRLALADRVGERILELLEREGDGAVAITGIPQHRRSGPECGDGQRQDTAERCRRDRDRNLGQPSASQDLSVISPPNECPTTAGFFLSPG
jgi:hypothetical protein